MALGVLDLIVLVASLAVSALIGLYFTNKNKSIDAYMRGDGRLSTLPVAVSLMTSCLSALTLLGSSAEFYYQGPSYAFVALPMLLCGPITAYTLLPIFYRLNELSLYQYLYRRYGNLIKYIVNIIYIVQMIFYNAVVLYLPSVGLETVLNIDRFYTILTVGIVCVIYSGFGGIKAVVWTDFFQAMCIWASIIVVGILGTYDAGGFKEVFREALEGGRLNLDKFWQIDLTTRHTFVGILFGSTIKHIYLVGVNQVQIQRALSLPSLRQSQIAFIYCSMFGASIILLSSYLGAVLVAAYRSCDPYLAGQLPRRDVILVHYVSRRLSQIPGLRGLLIAGICSATLSTLSSFANSMAALALEDFIKPAMEYCGRGNLNSSTRTMLAKFLAALFGAIGVLMAYTIEKANSRLLQATTTMFGAIGAPFVTAFALGIFTRFINTAGILVGFIVTLSFGLYVTLTQTFVRPPLEPVMPIYYSEQCEAVFNMTMKPSSLPTVMELFEWEHTLGFAPEAKLPFSLEHTSYMMLPCIQFVLMLIVSSVVSLLTCGWSQQVDDEYLVPMMHKGNASSRSLNDRTNNNNNNNDDDEDGLDGSKRTWDLIEQRLGNRSSIYTKTSPGFVNKAFDNGDVV